MLNKIKCGGELGQRGGWIPSHDVTKMCILDLSTILNSE
jgi:hypothetical protein